MTLRWPTSRSRTLAELEDRVGELVGQLEPVVLPNQVVETTEKAFAHGLGEVPGWVGWDPPHCVSVVRQTRAPTKTCIYLKATVQCVVNIRMLRAGPLGPGGMANGGYHLPDWDPEDADDHLVIVDASDTTPNHLIDKIHDTATVTATVVEVGGERAVELTATTQTGDHKFATDATDEAASGAGYALDKLSSTGNVKPTLDTSSGQRRTQFNVTLPTVPTASDDDPLPLGDADPGTGTEWSRDDHVHPLSPTPAITTTFYGSLEDSPAEDQSLVPVCPTSLGLVEVALPGTTDPSSPIPFGTLAGSPGLVYWSGGVVNIVVRARIRDMEVGATHLLAADLWRVPLAGDPVHYSDHYVGSYDDSIALTGDLQTLRFTAKVKPLTGATTDRLLVNFLELPGIGGSLPTEYLAIQTGSFAGTVEIPDATQIQTVFGPDTGGAGVHNTLDGRDAADCHPQSSITPGRVHTPCTGCTESGGLVTVPDGYNGGSVTPASKTIKGISAVGWSTGDSCFLLVQNATNEDPYTIYNDSGDVDTADRLKLGEMGQGSGQDIIITQQDCRLEFRHFGLWYLTAILEATR